MLITIRLVCTTVFCGALAFGNVLVNAATTPPVAVSVQSPAGSWRPFQNGQNLFNPEPNPKTSFLTIPESLQNLNLNFWYLGSGFGWPNVNYGKVTFTVLEDGPVWMLTTTRFNGGGNSSGNWMPEVTLQSGLAQQGWNLIDSTITSTEYSLLLFERNSVAGETFTYRTEKYIPPIIISSAAVPEPGVCFLGIGALGALAMSIGIRRRRVG